MSTIEVTSTAFAHEEPIPKKYTGEGADVSPPISWSGLPGGTKEIAIICDDPDAPTTTPWVHWVIYGIASDVQSLPAGLPPDKSITEPVAALQGQNSWPDGQTIGYRGPLPPPGHGVHRYYFKLYALDTPLSLQPGLTKDQLLKAMQGHILATGELLGTYERK